jgi:hypothetical protein
MESSLPQYGFIVLHLEIFVNTRWVKIDNITTTLFILAVHGIISFESINQEIFRYTQVISHLKHVSASCLKRLDDIFRSNKSFNSPAPSFNFLFPVCCNGGVNDVSV